MTIRTMRQSRIERSQTRRRDQASMLANIYATLDGPERAAALAALEAVPTTQRDDGRCAARLRTTRKSSSLL